MKIELNKHEMKRPNKKSFNIFSWFAKKLPYLRVSLFNYRKIFSRKVRFALASPSGSYKVARILVTSFSCFILGGILTTGILVNINKNNLKNGKGGLETSVIPEYKDDFETLEDNSLAEDVNFQLDKGEQVAVAEKAENSVKKKEVKATEVTPEQIQTQQNTVQAALPSQEEMMELTYLTYRVRKGDMIGLIADSYGVTQDSIISINNIKQSRLLQVGQYLKIPSMSGILYTVKDKGETPETIAKKYEIDAQKCAFVNNTTVASEFTSGSTIFIPDAELDWATRQEINGDLFRKPLHARYWLSSPYGWRNSPFNTGKRSFHGGIDMAISQGTPIYAAMDGVVSATGYNATYGNYVIVTHHSGYKTLYGHMSKILCKKGNFVYTTTKIGLVGSTGQSTGPHLHFTVYKNGKTVNPLGLIN